MILKLALLFTVVPTVELAILIAVGTWIGVIPATLIVIVTGFLGAWLAKREGSDMLRRLRADLDQGIPPARHIAEGAMVLLGGVLLITPGILTDGVGFLLIVPLSRRWLAPIVVRLGVRWLTGSKELADAIDFGRDTPSPPPKPATPGRRDSPFDHPTPEPWSPSDDR